MADLLPTGVTLPEALDAAERESRIEHLLMAGLDQDFAGAFESAINLWTRVLFLDRTHDRARAYIVRARTAQAEQQRASEALVHEGLEAFGRGEVEQARALLRDALERGASHDLALGVLGRIDRLDVGQSVSVRPVTPAPARRFPPALPVHESLSTDRPRVSARWLLSALAGALLAAVAGAWVASGGGALWPGRPSARPIADRHEVAPVMTAPLPVPMPAAVYLERSRTLFAEGKLRDALRMLDRVPPGDSLHADADRVRADIQRSLLDLAVSESADAVGASPRAAPPE